MAAVCVRDSTLPPVGLAIAADAYTIECMAGLYEVEIEPEIRSWLASLSNRDFGRKRSVRAHTASRTRCSTGR
jgi:hypothetical protein